MHISPQDEPREAPPASAGPGIPASAGPGIPAGVGSTAHDDPATSVPGDALSGPHGEALRSAQRALTILLALLHDEPAPPGEVLALAEQLGSVVTQARAAHTIAVGHARASGMWAVVGYASSASWLRDTQLMDGGRARALELTAVWLDQHPLTRQAFASGRISAEHVAGLRRVTGACPKRARAYPTFEADLLEVAANTDPLRTLAVLKAWADTVDSTAADAEARHDHERRSLHLAQVADGWDLRGWLPAAEGAELSGLLNEVMEQRRRQSDDNALDPPATRRLDALMDIVRVAAGSPNLDGTGPFVSPGARHRARVVVTVPAGRLFASLGQLKLNKREGPRLDDPSVCAGSWRCNNGPGEGFLSISEVLRLSCDAEVQRLVIGPQSQPLDIGRSTRVVPDHMRTALHQRDGGCVMPGCRRPPGWCEAHHIEHWSAGGDTAIQNLALTCARHHHELHNGKWSITMLEGLPKVRRIRSNSPPRGNDGA